MEKIRAVSLQNRKSIEKLLAELFPDLPDPLYLADTRTHKLYLASDFELYSVHNPYSGEQVQFDKEMELQGFMGPRSVWLYQSLHKVFLEEGGRLVDREGIELETRPYPNQTWSRAIIESAFK